MKRFFSLKFSLRQKDFIALVKGFLLIATFLAILPHNVAKAQLEDGQFSTQFESYKSFDNRSLEQKLLSPENDIERMVVWVTLIQRQKDNGFNEESYKQTEQLFTWALETKNSRLIWTAYRKISSKYRTLNDFEGLETIYEGLIKKNLNFDPYLAFKLPYLFSVHYAAFAKFQDMYEMLEPTLAFMDNFNPSTPEQTLTLAGALHNYGQVLLRRNRYAEAIDYFFKSERIYQNNPAIRNLIFIPHAVLSEGYLRIKDYEKAEFYARESLKNFIKDRIDGRIFVIANLASAVLEQGRVPEALDILKMGEIFIDQSRKDYRIYYYFSLTDVQLKLNAFDMAKEAALKAMKLANELGDKEMIVEATHSLGLSIALTTDPETGEELIQEAIAMAEGDSVLSAEEPFESLVYLYEYHGDFEKALLAHKNLKIAADAAIRDINFSVVADLESVKALRKNEREKERLIEEQRRNELALEVSHRENQISRILNISLSVGTLILLVILAGVIVFFKMIRRSNRDVERVSTEDTLTKLKNRRFIKIFMEEESKRLDRSGEKGLFMLADIDHLSDINETHSMEVGDQVIVQAAKILKASLRSEDIVSRWGGGKFLVICRNPDDDFAVTICQRILNTFVDHPMGAEENPFKVTISLGLTNFYGASRGLDWKASTHIADAALREVKAKGGNNWLLKE